MAAAIPRSTLRLRNKAVPFVLVAALAIATLTVGNPLLVTGEASPVWDATTVYAPSFIYTADLARRGKLNLWNPLLAAGRPDGADPQVGAYSPITLVGGLVFGPSRAGFLRFWLSIWALGAIGFLFLCRSFGTPWWGSAICAVGWTSSGIYLTNGEHTTIVLAASLLPFLIWRFDRALRSDQWLLPALQAGAIWGLSGMSGYPSIVLMTPIFLGTWALGRMLSPLDSESSDDGLSRPDLRRTLSVLLVLGVVGCAVLAPTYVGFALDAGAYTDRSEGLSRDSAIGANALHPGTLITLISPIFANTSLIDREIWQYTDPSMTSSHTGITVLVLAVVALSRRNRWAWSLAVAALLFLSFALGQALPIRGWLYDFYYPSRYFRHPAILRTFFIFGVVVLAAHAARDVNRGLISSKRLLSAALLAAGAVVSIFFLSDLPVPRPLIPYARNRVILAAFLAPTLIVLLRHQWAKRAAAALLVVLVSFEALGSFTLNRRFLYSSNPGAWALAEAAENSTERSINRLPVTPYGARQYNNLNQVSGIATFSNVDPMQSRIYRVWAARPELSQLVTGTDRFWFSAAPTCSPEITPTFRQLRQEVNATKALPVILHDAVHCRGNGSTASERIRLTHVEMPPYEDSWSFQIEAPSSGWLLLTDRFAPGWRATVDGKATRVHRASFLFQAIELSPGSHRVEMTYRPTLHPWLLIASWGSLLLIGVSSLISGCRPRVVPSG